MDVGVGLDHTLGLSFAEEARLAQEAAALGYDSIWTPETPGKYDSFQLCVYRWTASRSVVPEGLRTGVAVSPVGLRTLLALAMSAATVSTLTNGRFVLGIGSGAIRDPAYRRAVGLLGLGPVDLSPVALMRDYVTGIRGLLGGNPVSYEGPTLALDGVRLEVERPPHTPVYVGALGPEMLRLGGELADGVVLNWCTPEQVAWSRDRVREGAARAGRDPNEVRIIAYIRVCVDEDVDMARQALARAILAYVRPGRGFSAYRSHFERMGFGEILALIDRLYDAGATTDALVETLPTSFLRRVGYYGPARGAASAVRALASSLDAAVVRVVPARPGAEAVELVMLACQPSVWKR